MQRARLSTCAAVCLAGFSVTAHAEERFVYMTNWFAQAEHGGFYQAVATGIYKKLGLDVSVRMGGPQVNIKQLMAAGQADCIMGSSDLEMIQSREGGLPAVTVAALFQKDPQVLIAHEDVKSLADMKGKTILISSSAYRAYWPWVRSRFGLTDAQTRPYTFNVQPFVADRNVVQQGYLTSEPFALMKAGVKAKSFLLADYGYPSYSTTISCMEETLKKRRQAVAAFVRGSVEGWKSYLANPGPGNALIRKDNPEMTDEQLAYSVAKLKENGIVTGGDAGRLGIGIVTEARERATFEMMVANKLVDPAKVDLARTYTTEFVKDLKILP